jgi:hypothetical protein
MKNERRPTARLPYSIARGLNLGILIPCLGICIALFVSPDKVLLPDDGPFVEDDSNDGYYYYTGPRFPIWTIISVRTPHKEQYRAILISLGNSCYPN